MQRITIPIRTLFAATVAAPLIAAGSASGGFTGMVIQNVTDTVGSPPGTKTLRVFATFDDATDEVVGCGGESAFAALEFTTDDPMGLRNDPVFDRDFPNQPLSTAWDSYVTIGSDVSALNAVVSLTPGTPSPLVQGTSFTVPDGGWFRNTLPAGVSGGSVEVAQFTIAATANFQLSGVVQWVDVNHPGYAASAFTVSSQGVSNVGACCLTPTLCIITTETACAVLTGQWLGVGSVCDTQIVSLPCHPGDVALHCVGVLLTCPDGGDSADGAPGCVPGPLVDPWESAMPIEPGDPTSFHDFGQVGQAVPADFFGPGSDPFLGQVALVSEPLGVVDLTDIGGGIVDFGNADTLILRSADPFDRCDIPGPTEVVVDIEIVALSLKSLQPIVVTFDGGQNPELWDVAVDLSEVATPPGGLSAIKTHDNGGLYDVFDLPVQPRFTFTKVGDPGNVQVLDTGLEGIPAVQLALSDGTWVSDLGPSAELLSPFCTDFHPGIDEEFPILDADCNNNGVRDLCDIESGTSGDCNFNDIPDDCEFPPCDEDLNGNYCVDFADILRIIAVWGPCPGCPEDLSGNDMADFADILIVIGAWGPCT